jgi:hypothetical protein
MMSDLKPRQNPSDFEKGVIRIIKSNFRDWGLFGVESNIRKYKPSEDRFVFGQTSGQIPEFADIYCKGKYVCEVNARMRPDEVLAMIQYSLIQTLK